MGKFPAYWKTSFTPPLYESHNRHHVANYRRIAKLNVLPKLFERIITSRINFIIKSAIAPCQHAFLKSRSSTANLLEFGCHVFEDLNQSRTDGCYPHVFEQNL